MQIDQAQAGALPGAVVYDPAGKRVGTIGHVWSDVTGQPAWVGVVTGLSGTRETLVPLLDARLDGAALHTAYDRDRIIGAPDVDISPDSVDVDRLRELYTHYGLVLEQGPEAAGETVPDPAPQRRAAASAGEEATVIRSEEQLRVGTRTEQTEKVRLRKYVVTENVTVTVPVRREEVRLERVPASEPDAEGDRVLSADEAAAAGAADGETEIILHAERPVVTTETVPVERVRFGKQSITGRETVTGEVRKEKIDLDLPERPE